MMVSIMVLGVLAGLAIPALGNLLSRNQAKAVAISFQDDLRLARYEARSRRNNIITFCSIASNVKNPTSINCSTTQGYTNGWLWYSGTPGVDAELLGKNYAPLDVDIGVTPIINFRVQIQQSTTTLWNRDDEPRTEITIPFLVGFVNTFPSITFSDTSGRSSVVVFDQTGHTTLIHN